jgi:hypothetical protein
MNKFEGCSWEYKQEMEKKWTGRLAEMRCRHVIGLQNFIRQEPNFKFSLMNSIFSMVNFIFILMNFKQILVRARASFKPYLFLGQLWQKFLNFDFNSIVKCIS